VLCEVTDWGYARTIGVQAVKLSLSEKLRKEEISVVQSLAATAYSLQETCIADLEAEAPDLLVTLYYC
jgi:hypothetical protein